MDTQTPRHTLAPELHAQLRSHSRRAWTRGLFLLAGFSLVAAGVITLAILIQWYWLIILAAAAMLPAISGLALMLKNRDPLKTPLGVALLNGGRGLSGVDIQHIVIRTLRRKLGAHFEIVFKWIHGGAGCSPWRFLNCCGVVNVKCPWRG